MNRTWVKPSFEEVSVNGECTAYAGAVRVGSNSDGGESGGLGRREVGAGTRPARADSVRRNKPATR